MATILSYSAPAAPPPPTPPTRRPAPDPIAFTPQGRRHHHHEVTKEDAIHALTPRRNALLLLLSLPILSIPSSATAFTIGFPGPKEWLKDQKRKAAKFVLAPIEASRQSLRDASLLIASDAQMDGSGEIRSFLNSATRDCVPQDRSSIVAFQVSTGVEVCTFRLIVKNASSLLDERDPVKLEAEAMLDDLIRSFASLGNAIDNSNFQLASERKKIIDGLMDSISALDKFEQGIKDCLGVI